MAPRQEADQDAVNHLLLADTDLPDLLADAVERAGCQLEIGIGVHKLIVRPELKARSAEAGRANLAWDRIRQ